MTEYLGVPMVVAWDPAGGAAYTNIGQLHDVQFGGISRDYVEISQHDHTDLIKRFIKGWKDGGDVTLIVIYDPALGTHDAATGLLSDFDEDSVIPNWRVTFPDAALTQWLFPGGLSSAKPGTPLQDKMTLEVTIKITGTFTLA